MPFWKRQPEASLHLSGEAFAHQLETLDPGDWAFALFEAARMWAPGPVDERAISAGIAADPALGSLIRLLERPTRGLKDLNRRVQESRQESTLPLMLGVMGRSFGVPSDPSADPQAAMRVIWLADSLAQLAAAGLACQNLVPRETVLRATQPFVEAVAGAGFGLAEA